MVRRAGSPPSHGPDLARRHDAVVGVADRHDLETQPGQGGAEHEEASHQRSILPVVRARMADPAAPSTASTPRLRQCLRASSARRAVRGRRRRARWRSSDRAAPPAWRRSRESSPITDTARSRSSTLIDQPPQVGRTDRQTGPLDDLDDQAATAEAMEPLADLAEPPAPAAAAPPVASATAPHVRSRSIGRHDDVVEPDGARAGARRTSAWPARRPRSTRPSMSTTTSAAIPGACCQRARPGGSVGSMRMPVPNSGTRARRRRSARGAPTARRRRRRRATRCGPSAIGRRPGSRSSCQARNVRPSASSSARLATGLPTPWPARSSWYSRIGRSSWHGEAACTSAAILRACSGSTRVSPSAVVNSVAG